MEEIGAQVASPVFIRQVHPAAKKRSLPFLQHPKTSHAWNPKLWEWDSTRFIAKPRESHMLGASVPTPVQLEVERHARIREEYNTTTTSSKSSNSIHVHECYSDLSLKLGEAGTHTSLNTAEEPAPRPNKRVRSGSPGSVSYPMCQVDDCKENLSRAKDYHRRHKVCEFHSKATKALVAKLMQRFCQQCSRFHPLSEFDEGKRSCRRRLAGHNRRRRKTQPEDASSQVLLPGNCVNTDNSNLDIVNLLAVLARAQENNEDKGSNGLSIPNKDQLLQILTKINSLPLPANLAAKLPIFGNLGRSVPNIKPSKDHSSFSGNTSPSTMDLLAVLSETPPVCAPNKLEMQPERSQGSDSEKTNSDCSDHVTYLNLNNGPALEFPCVGGERSSSSEQSPVDYSDCHIDEIHTNLPLQLFSSSPEDDCPPKNPASQKYFSSDSSNPSEERSPSYSPPVVHKLFPVRTLRETLKHGNMSSSGDADANSRPIRDSGCNTSLQLQLFAGSGVGHDTGSIQSLPYHAGYTSSSGSDHSPSSMNSDTQDRTGRIIFKLFDKDPSHLPGTLRTQIHYWLLNSPSEMESYIRPGCVVLSVYVSMSLSSWEQFDENLLHYVKSLIRDFDTDFWGNGRFLIYTGKQLASHVDGKLRIYKTQKAWCSPELLSVSPVAVVGGQETSLLLRGRNLNMSGTKINCSHTGDYTVKGVSGPACEEPEYDEISLCDFKVCTTASTVLGRCFIEVENGLRTTTFPVIIADKSICQELRLLEYDIFEDVKENGMSAHRPRSREEVLHFLNELGWLFQRKCNFSLLESPDYKISRFRFLFIFSVECDFCFLVKSLLDILLEINLGKEGLKRESLEMLSEIHPLNRAVKRRCRNMIDLLINYSIGDSSDTSKKYIFTPNLVGPGGVTPLHLAASTLRSDDLVDALTSDPQEIGLHCWNSLLDANGLSPYSYAAMRNNHSYNRLVAQKLANKENGQVSVSIGNEIEQIWSEINRDYRPVFHLKWGQKSCHKCATAAVRYRRIPGSQGLLHRPYIHSMLAIAAVCVCVCLFFRGAPDIGLVAPFKWENLGYGPI
ncbi:hypothetical protein ACH5RR_035373 [Cinchona calisaya]|uniref:SBP-type domain-containing protein n=1 Tax=Cinchona calisaya TaxID=153742 RepID=A0ABD2YI32_9GENT